MILKYLNSFQVLFISIFITSCQLSPSQMKIQPHSQLVPQKFSSMLELLPSSAFDHTTEGLSETELQQLLQKDFSGQWKIRKRDHQKIIFTAPPSSTVTFYNLPGHHHHYLLQQTENGQNLHLHFWQYQPEKQQNKQQLVEVNLFIHPTLKDFLIPTVSSQTTSISIGIACYALDSHQLECTPLSWMNPVAEKMKDKLYSKLLYQWNGHTFTLHEKRI